MVHRSHFLEDTIDGNLLGDGSVFLDRGKYARFKITAKDESYLYWIGDMLKSQGLNIYFSKDKRNKTFILYVSTGKFFTDLRKKWYRVDNGKTLKIVPNNLEINSTTLLFWYLGDGCLIRPKGNRVPWVVLATNCFSKGDADLLIEKLQEVKLNFYPVAYKSGFTKKSCGYAIYSNVQDGTVFRFFNLIGLSCPEEIKNCITGNKGRGSKTHYFGDKWPTQEDWFKIMSNQPEIGRIVKERRIELGFTKRSCAARTGMSVRHLRHIEFQDRCPSVPMLRKISKSLDLSTIYMLQKLVA
ncbi:MAG: helix-turn-helix domain-containing protein [Candidatus Aenigmarchaeota archaeon]|nr:helix-turn-helix domain-containing protein [Candidatus Aenigmarchaeota archaeon]